MDNDKYDENLLRLNRKTNLLEPRRKNYGKEITDNLPKIAVDDTVMDLYSNVSSLEQGPEITGAFLIFLPVLNI